MKKIFLIIFLILIILPSISLAQSSLKTIHLKDGTTLMGEVIGFQNGTYTIQTSQLGQLQIADSQIESIASPAAATTTNQQSLQEPSNEQTDVKNEAQKIQADILSNPELMADVKDLVADPEVQKLLSNPELVKTIMSYDPHQIQQSEDVQKLMQNPKMKMLMEKMSQQQK